jgi:serine/threonine-protein kinase
VDSSLPVLVSRLPDRRAFARLVRAALRHEVAQVELAYGPQRAETHTLDLRVAGQPPLVLLAEPAGAPRNGHFPLRLRPLHHAQAAQLYALLEAENVAVEGPPDAFPIDTPNDRTLAMVAPIHHMTMTPAGKPGAGEARSGPGPSASWNAAPASVASGRTVPIAWRPTPPPTNDPRHTAPSASWGAPLGEPRPQEAHHAPTTDDDLAGDGAFADDRSFSVSVVFEPEDIPPAVKAMRAQVLNADAPGADGSEEPPPSDTPSDSVSVVFEPDALPRAALAGIPSPLGVDRHAPAPHSGSTSPPFVAPAVDDETPITEPPSTAPVTMADPGWTGARETPPSREAPASSYPTDDDDNDATLIRSPMSSKPGAFRPAERSVRDGTRAPDDLTLTEQTNVTPEQTRWKTTDRSGSLDALKDDVLLGGTGGSSDGATDGHEASPPVSPPDRTPNDPSSSDSRRKHDPAVGRRLADGKYIIESLIGSGAAGAVYRATHRELRRTVAIKILHPHYQQDPQFMDGFRDEALAASQLDHPNVMRVLDFDQEADGLIYIVMEYLSGRTLQSVLDEERRLPTERAVEIMIQVCAALSVAHDHGIIHRDIKPDNIMLVPSRNDEGTTFELVKVCDFGIAALQNPRADQADSTASESVITGTPEYMSPEQAQGTAVDARSDVYACGICLYELVTGRPPFLGKNPMEILVKQIQEVPKPPSHIVHGLDPIVEEIVLRAIQKDPAMRHRSAREMRFELKELIEPGDGDSKSDRDDLSIVENVPVLDDPASGFTAFFTAFSSAVLRFGRFERGHHEAAQAMKELSKSLRVALRGRSELTFARRDTEQGIGFAVMTGSAEIVDLRRVLGSQLYGDFGQPFIEGLLKKGVAALTLREGVPDVELHYVIEILLGPTSGEDLRKEVLSRPLRHVSVLFVTDVIGGDRALSWKVGLGASRLARDLRALCNVRGISLRKMRETRDELVGGVARLLTRGDEVKQFLFNADLVDDAVANLRGFSSFQVAPLMIERVRHESCAEAATLLLTETEVPGPDEERILSFLPLFARRLVTERSPRSDAAVAELYRRKIITEDDVPRDLKESIRAETLARALAHEPSQFLLTLDLISDPETYVHELTALEAAMAALARRAEAVALLAVMSMLARHAKGTGMPGPRENAALRTMKSMLDKQRLLPIANALLVGPAHQREAARQLIVLAGSVGAAALHAAREVTLDPAARPMFVKVLRETGPAGSALLVQVLPRMEVRDDKELALVEDLLRAVPERADPVLGEAVAKFLAHPVLRPAALTAIVPLWGERARKPLVDALEYAEEPTRIVALNELRRLRAIDEHVVAVIERLLTLRGSAGEELRASAAAALTDVAAPSRARAVQLLAKAVEGRRGIVAMLRGSDGNDESILVMEAMGRALVVLDRAEGIRALKARLARSDGLMKQRLTGVLHTA